MILMTTFGNCLYWHLCISSSSSSSSSSISSSSSSSSSSISSSSSSSSKIMSITQALNDLNDDIW